MAAHVAAIQLTGHDLTVDDVEAVALHGAGAALASEAVAQIEASRALIERVVREERPTYGVNTGFGACVKNEVDREQAYALARNLPRYHGCGVGPYLSLEESRAVMLVRLSSLAADAGGALRERVRA